MRRACYAVVFVLLLSCRGGAAPAPRNDMPQPAVRFETSNGPWIVQVELARTQEQRTRGLMFRRELGRDRGMVFLFDETSEHPFWMHNTLIPLDIIFLGDDRRVVGVVANAAPQTDTQRTVGKPSRYVVEASGGEAGAHGVGPGTSAVFVGIEE